MHAVSLNWRRRKDYQSCWILIQFFKIINSPTETNSHYSPNTAVETSLVTCPAIVSPSTVQLDLRNLVERFSTIHRVSGPYPPDFFKKLHKRQEEYLVSEYAITRYIIGFTGPTRSLNTYNSIGNNQKYSIITETRKLVMKYFFEDITPFVWSFYRGFLVKQLISSLPAKMRQSHLFTLIPWWVYEMILSIAFCWLAGNKWYGFPLSMIKSWIVKNRREPVLYAINAYSEPTKQVHKNLLQKLNGQRDPDSVAPQTSDSHRNLQLRKLESRLASYMERIHSYLIFMSQIPGFQNIPNIDKTRWQVVSHNLWTRHRLRNISKVVTKIYNGLLSLVTGYKISLFVGIGLFPVFFLASVPQKGFPEFPTFYSGARPHVLLLSLIMIVLTNQLQGI